MINQKQLCEFLVKAKKSGYAAGKDSKIQKEADNSKTITFQEWDRQYHDNYFGWEPYGGREIVFFKWMSVYIMVYYGYVDKSVQDVKSIYRFLQRALTQIPTDKPFRWPTKYQEDKLLYLNSFTGEIDNFYWEENITLDNKEIYKARYVGWLVDQR